MHVHITLENPSKKLEVHHQTLGVCVSWLEHSHHSNVFFSSKPKKTQKILSLEKSLRINPHLRQAHQSGQSFLPSVYLPLAENAPANIGISDQRT
jgi:hypothetical protein